MTVLALDTTQRGSATLALLSREGELLGSVTVPGPLDVNVPPLVRRLVAGELEAVVVLTGPGSYTGVRAGMALALGIATARGIPLHGSDVLTAIAGAARATTAVTAALDAGRGGAYAQAFAIVDAGPTPTSDARRVEWSELRDQPGVVTPTPVDGVDATHVAPADVLAAAVPLALAAAALTPAGLAAQPAPPG